MPGTTPVSLCFETLSPVNITLHGAEAYIKHPSFKVICFAVALPYNRVIVWDYRKDPPKAGSFDVICGHNAMQFHKIIWEDILGLPKPKEWVDTRLMAEQLGFQNSTLSALRREDLFKLPEDDVDARARILRLNSQYAHSGVEPILTDAELNLITSSCVKRARAVFQLWKKLDEMPSSRTDRYHRPFVI